MSAEEHRSQTSESEDSTLRTALLLMPEARRSVGSVEPA
jgi:hypothetical protein